MSRVEGACGWPEPTAEAREHSRAVTHHIAEEIGRAGGRIPFERYMHLALYAPGLGYYAAGAARFADAGDFVTAPEISSLFSRCVARQTVQILDEVPDGCVLEVGAGTGRMACDVLESMHSQDRCPQRYEILETSPTLRQQQAVTLADWVRRGVVHWVDALPDEFQGVILANELLDAMPVPRFVIADPPLELFVACANGEFEWQTGPTETPGLAEAVEALRERLPSPLPSGYCSEIGLNAGHWLRSAVSSLDRGALLVFDYGYPAAEYYHPQRSQGTLTCFYRHRRHADPFRWPGLQDITAHIDYSAMAAAATAAGATVAGFSNQAGFLLSCGVTEHLSGVEPGSVEYLRLATELKRLTLPGEMGDVVKAFVCTRNVTAPLLGFSEQNYAERLGLPR